MERGKLPGMQVGRALAALAVFYFHSHIALGFFDQNALYTIPLLATRGASGVELFFSISGFIFCYVAGRPDFSPLEFLKKRVFRIYPLNALVTVVIMLLILGGLGIANSFGLPSVVRSLLIVPQKSPINSVGWTLEFEMMFYILAAVLMPIGGKPLLLIYCVVSGVLGTWLDPRQEPLIARLVNFHYFEFGAGIVAYYAFERLAKLREIHAWILSALLIGLAALLFRFLPAVTTFYVAPFCLVAVIGLTMLPWAPAWLVKLGDVSYGFYLIHWPVLFLMDGAARIVHPDPSLGELWRWLAFLFVWLLAHLSWTYFEGPINRLAGRKPTPSQQPSPAIV